MLLLMLPRPPSRVVAETVVMLLLRRLQQLKVVVMERGQHLQPPQEQQGIATKTHSGLHCLLSGA